MNTKVLSLVLATLPLLVGAACSKKEAAAAEEEAVYVDPDSIAIYLRDPKGSPPDVAGTAEMVELGKMLFSEKKLSKAGDVSCASCHDPAKHYADPGKAQSAGTGGALTRRNTPSLVNTWKHAMFFWDYRSTSLEEAVLEHTKEATTLGLADDAALVAKLKEVASAPESFKKAFPKDADAVSAANYKVAVGAFLRTLTAKTRFEAYLDGDDKALSSKEKKGLKLFTGELNCKTCHVSRLVGGDMQQKFGLVKPHDTKDLGRYEVTKNDAEKYMYKVPSLINVSRTAPYFHDGSGKTLEEAVKSMELHQFMKDVKPDDLANLIAFLGALDSK